MATRQREKRIKEIMESWVEAEHVLNQLDAAQSQHDDCKEELAAANERIVELETQWGKRNNWNIGGEKNVN